MANVIFICDSSVQIGTGHVSRCLILAKKLAALSHNITFICRNLPGNISSKIEEQGYLLHLISSSKSSTSFEVSNDEEKLIFDTAIKISPKWVVLDHYGLSESFETKFLSLKIKVFIIGDFAYEHNCTAYLCPSLATKPVKNAKYNFIGAQYALISDSFHHREIKIRDKVANILVFFGGTDPTGLTPLFLKEIKKHQLLELKFIVVTGSSNPRLSEIKNLVTPKIELHIDTNRMADLMSESDLYIGSGGSITWERSVMGIPAICLSVADNQIPMSKALQDLGTHEYLGDYKQISTSTLIDHMLKLCTDKKRREQYSQKSLSLNVGHGLDKVIKIFDNDLY